MAKSCRTSGCANKAQHSWAKKEAWRKADRKKLPKRLQTLNGTKETQNPLDLIARLITLYAMQATKTKTFRPYQHEASEAIIKGWLRYRSIMCVLATGAGKTLIAAGTAAKIKNTGRILFLANRNELCQQPLEVFLEQTGEFPGLEKAESRADLDSNIVIGSVQTLCRQNRLERFPKDHFRYVFADEAHGAMADSWKRIFDHFCDAKICGITATPFRSDAKKLTDIFEFEAYRKGLFDLVDEGFLVSPDHVDRLQTAISLANVRVKRTVDGVDYDMNDAHDAIAPYFEAIAKELKERHDNKHILAFLPLVASSEKFVAICQKAGLNAVHVDGMDPEREQKLEAFKDGRITLLSNSNLLHTGVDFPVCNCTLNLRPTRSRVLYQQIVGRSTRTEPGVIDGVTNVQDRLNAIARSSKPMSFIIDPMWLSIDHDLITPAFLVAQNEEIAEAMNAKAGESYSLRELNREVEAEREEAMIRRFENVGRFRDGRINHKYFAACIKDHALFHYEPVYASELQPVRKFTKDLLRQRGIDPEGIQTDGEAWQICLAVNRRRYHGLAEIRDLAKAVELGMETEAVWNLTKEQARRLK